MAKRTHSTSITTEVTLGIMAMLAIIGVAIAVWPETPIYELQATTGFDNEVHVWNTYNSAFHCMEEAIDQRSRWGTNVTIACVRTNPEPDTPFTRFEV
jgi:hypothetical protein